MSFDPNDPRITAYVLDELDAGQRQAFEAELAVSGELRQAVAATRQATEQLAAELRTEPLASLSGPRRDSVLQAARARDTAGATAGQAMRSPAGRRARWLLGGAAIAASLVGLCWAGFQVYRQANQRQLAAVTGPADASRDRREEAEELTAALTPQAAPTEALGLAPGRTNSDEYARPADAPVREAPATVDSIRFHVQPAAADASQPVASSPYGGAMAASAPAPAAGMGPGMGMGGMPGAAPAPGGPMPPASMMGGAGYVGGDPGMSMGMMGSAPAPMSMDVAGQYGMPGMPATGLAEYEVPPGTPLPPADYGRGPGQGGDQYQPIVENPFQEVKNEPLSTFSIDVDTASYSKVRMVLMQQGVLPRPDAVRIEELVNYFTYDYAPPTGDEPFASHLEVAECPWAPAHRLVRVGIKGKQIERDQRPTSNLVFLLDVSGSMNEPNKLPLVKHGMKLLVDQLGENDQVAIVVYAGAAGLVLDSTTGDRKQVILDALDRLHAGGSTNGGDGIRLAYQTALDHFVRGGVNRVILCTDGDFNVGVTGTDELVRMAEQNAKTGVFLSVLGFGMGNHNDAMLEQVSGKGNGNYAFIDTEAEARKVLIEQMTGTLITIAKDVKIQVEFNPQRVAAYRLIGYENRILAAQDFNDDKKDAGEIGAGHTVTALYEIVPAGAESGVSLPPVDELKYQPKNEPTTTAGSDEMLTLKIRYKQPDGDTSSKLEFPLRDEGRRFGQATRDFRFAASVAAFGMLLRNSPHRGNASFAGVQEIAAEAASGDSSGYRDEFLRMLAKAKELAGQ